MDDRRSTPSTLTGRGEGRLGQPNAAGVLVRGRLEDRLDVGVRRAVTLVCAGPGWGKTSLVAAWARNRARSGPIAWLSLGAEHNDPGTFWFDVLLALRTAGVPVYAAAPVRKTLDDLRAPVVLVLDDLHEVTAPPVLEGLGALLRDAPRFLRLVLLSRAEPTLPLHRFRAAGALTEIREADLAFRVAEAGEMLSRPDGATDPGLQRLVGRAEGWAAGLSLLSGSDSEATGDYLIHEVLDGQPAELRRFLLRTSVTDRICGELADALTGGTRGRRTLERLHRANLFTRPVDADRRWFRYHPLLREVLRHELLLENPAAGPQLHLLAAQWFAGQGAATAALEHAADARDWTFVGRLVVDHALPAIMSAGRPELTSVLERIPPARLGSTAELTLCAAALLYRSGERWSVADHVARVRSGTHRLTVEVAARVLEAGAVIRSRGDMACLITASTEVLRLLTGVRPGQLPSLREYRALALADKGVGLLWAGRADHADRYLWAACTTARVAGLELVEIDALSHLALLALMQGSMRDAEEYAVTARDRAAQLGPEPPQQSAVAHLTLALIDIKRNRVPQAQEALRHALHAQGAMPDPLLASVCDLVLVHLLLARDEPAAARAQLRQLRLDASPMLGRWVDFLQSEIDLSLGEPQPVLARHQEAVLESIEHSALARAALQVGDLARAELHAVRAREGGDRTAAVYGWIVSALVADTQGHDGRAVHALNQAMLTAAEDDLRQPFRRFDTRRINALLERQRWVGEQAATVVLDRVSADPAPAGRPPGPSDVLSEREMDVLRYMPTVLTAAEIAVNLSISVNTVKAHMRSIYRKLDAARRREAVVRARQRGLL
ncbi:MAG: LuxR C-terminal-related transcriptional regulator [Actinoplanes sp.]